MANYLANSFSIQMLTPEGADISIRRINAAEVPADAESCIGHPDTAAVVSDMLEREVPANRTSISLEQGDVLYVAQLTGGRLPEGATTLPEGFHLDFYQVVPYIIVLPV